MKKLFAMMTVALACSMTVSAQPTRSAMQAMAAHLAKAISTNINKAPVLTEDVQVTPPESATLQTDWVLTGSYQTNDYSYPPRHGITIAVDGRDIYIQGLSYYIEDAWVKGVLEGDNLVIANAQFYGQHDTEDGGVNKFYCCGSTDGQTLDDVIFAYNAVAHTLTLSNFLIENSVTDEINFYLYSNNLQLVRNINVPMPTDLTVVDEELKPTSARVTWTEAGEAAAWNLRYREAVDDNPTLYNRIWDFENEDQLKEWELIDNDGDEYTWTYYRTNAGNGVASSASYINGVGALTPDNWMISPTVGLGGTLSFDAYGLDANYSSEKFAVYVAVGEPETVSDFVKISDDITATKTQTTYTFDLSAYQGVGHVAIRHYNVTDMYWLLVDNIKVDVPNGIEKPQTEWTVVEGVNEPEYTIEQLTSSTKYEVQVQSTNAEFGMGNSEWTESTLFTTPEVTVAVEEVRVSDNNDNVWYNLQGMKFNGMPNQPGVYINAGKKVILK